MSCTTSRWTALALTLGSTVALASMPLESALERATLGPDNGAEINGAVTYLYEPNLHYRIFTKPLHVTDIQLEPGETLTGEIAAGDTARWQVAVSYSGTGADLVTHLQVKPAKAGLSTNFVVTTDRRSYAILAESSNNAFMPLVRFRYANGVINRAPPPTPVPPSRSGLDVEGVRFDYEMRVSRRQRVWAPEVVFQDGKKTYVRFADLKSIEAPVVFALKDKQETLVNYRVVGNVYVIDGVLDALVLKQGPKDVIRVRRKQP